MIDFSIKNLGEFEYDNQNWLQHLKNPFDRKIRSEVCLLLPLFINRSIKKHFPIKTLLEMIDSSIKNFGKLDYDKQNRLQHLKNPSDQIVRSNVYLLLPLYKNRNESIPKKFPIKTITERIDSSIKNLGHIESVLFKSVLIRNFFVMDQFISSGNAVAIQCNPHFKFFGRTWISWCCRLFFLSYLTSLGFSTQESIIFKCALVGNFFVATRFLTIRWRQHCDENQHASAWAV
jgi:hypothetical protein